MCSLDETAVQSLRDSVGNDADFLADLIGGFLAEAPSQLEALRTAVAAGDAAEARRGAHTLKSNAATFGIPDLERVCRELEGRARENDLGGAGPLVSEIERALGEARLPLQALAAAT